MEDNMTLVDFAKYCPICRYFSVGEVHDPCNDCLSVPARDGSEKPEKYDEKE